MVGWMKSYLEHGKIRYIKNRDLFIELNNDIIIQAEYLNHYITYKIEILFLDEKIIKELKKINTNNILFFINYRNKKQRDVMFFYNYDLKFYKRDIEIIANYSMKQECFFEIKVQKYNWFKKKWITIK
jgi:hypothetical protein